MKDSVFFALLGGAAAALIAAGVFGTLAVTRYQCSQRCNDMLSDSLKICAESSEHTELCLGLVRAEALGCGEGCSGN